MKGAIGYASLPVYIALLCCPTGCWLDGGYSAPPPNPTVCKLANRLTLSSIYKVLFGQHRPLHLRVPYWQGEHRPPLERAQGARLRHPQRRRRRRLRARLLALNPAG